MFLGSFFLLLFRIILNSDLLPYLSITLWYYVDNYGVNVHNYVDKLCITKQLITCSQRKRVIDLFQLRDKELPTRNYDK